MNDRAAPTWGENITIGARVTSAGRHGTGQPIVTGRVSRIDRDGQTVTVMTAAGPRKRTISNLRAI